jgi:hypothetical protein
MNFAPHAAPSRREAGGASANAKMTCLADRSHPAIEKFVAKSPLGAEGAHCGAPLDCIR